MEWLSVIVASKSAHAGLLRAVLVGESRVAPACAVRPAAAATGAEHGAADPFAGVGRKGAEAGKICRRGREKVDGLFRIGAQHGEDPLDEVGATQFAQRYGSLLCRHAADRHVEGIEAGI